MKVPILNKVSDNGLFCKKTNMEHFWYIKEAPFIIKVAFEQAGARSLITSPLLTVMVASKGMNTIFVYVCVKRILEKMFDL